MSLGMFNSHVLSSLNQNLRKDLEPLNLAKAVFKKATLHPAGSDASVVRRTQRTIGSWGRDTVHFTASVSVTSKWNLLLLGILNFIFSTLAAWQLGRLLLLSFPEFFSFGVFTKKGPTHEQMQASSFSMLLIGKGYSSGKLLSKYRETFF